MAASILDEIVAYKRTFLEAAQGKQPLSDIKKMASDAPPARGFRKSLETSDEWPVRVIAEVKKGSPSKGVIRDDFDPLIIAESYAEHGAAAISVLTDEHYFLGHLDFLTAIHDHLPATPLLRKDFTIGEYQIYEARASGASAILLIAAILDKHQLRDYRQLAESLGMDALTEVHLEKEADLVAELGARLIGINNRNLHDFSVDLAHTERIINLLGAGGASDEFLFVAESGIRSGQDVIRLKDAGARAILVGETFMREREPGGALQRLLQEALSAQDT